MNLILGKIVDRANSLLDAVTDSITDGFVLVDSSGNIQAFNPACERILGYHKLEVENRNFEDLLSGDQRLRLEEKKGAFGERLTDMVGAGCELFAKAKSGEVISLYATLNHVEMDDESSYCILLRDMRNQREQEEIFVNEVMKRSELEQKNFMLNENINYARRIHQSITPSSEDFNCFDEHFVIYRPKEIVGGDFYWIKEKNDEIFVAVVGCNMNGVSGGYMSLLVNTHLEYVTNSSRSNSPAKILNNLNTRLQKVLGYDKEEEIENMKGFHVGLCKINVKERKVTFAGAKRSLLVIGNNSYKEMLGDTMCLANSKGHRSFTENETILQPHETIYLMSDGFASQQNADGDKYGRARLIDLILSNAMVCMEGQREAIEQRLDGWMAGEEQDDDITLLGIKI